MTITVPAALTVNKTQALVGASADQSPLLEILNNSQHIYSSGPAMLAAVYTCADKITGRSAIFEIPILPSADSINYRFVHHVRTGTGTSNVMIQVEEWNGSAWNTLETASTAAGANTVIKYEHTDPIDAAATKIKITIARATGGDQFTPDSITVYPLVSSVSVGQKPSTYVPFDDGLLTTAGAPIHTELFNRAAANALRVLRDRYQCALSFVQENSAANARLEVSAAGLGAGVFARLGRARFCCPYQVDPQITIKVLASVDGGSTANIARVAQTGMQGESALFAASGAIVSGNIRCKTSGDHNACADLEISATHTSGQETTIHAVVAFWRPGD